MLDIVSIEMFVNWKILFNRDVSEILVMYCLEQQPWIYFIYSSLLELAGKLTELVSFETRYFFVLAK